MQKINAAQFGRFFIEGKMRKTLAFLFAFVASIWALPATAVGTIPGISLSQQFDSTGLPLGGGLLYLIQAGTTSTPQNCFQDTAMTIAYPNPVVLDAYGRVPQLFCADGQIKVRLTDKNGVQKFVQDNLLIIGASSGGGGGGTVDPTTILTTGDFKMEYGTGPIAGFVRCNGRTIGSATSGATERANADTSALYSYLWGVDPNLVVTGGRGANAAADFAANKPLAVPDCRGRALAGLDDMGNSAAGRLTATYWGSTGGCSSVSPTTLGAGCGSESQTLTLAQLPTGIGSGGTFTANQSIFVAANANVFPFSASPGSAPFQAWQQGASVSITAPTGPVSVTSNNTSGNAHPIASPLILTTFYIKL